MKRILRASIIFLALASSLASPFQAGVSPQNASPALAAPGDLGSWQTTIPLPRKRYTHDAAYANGYIYVVGGMDSGFIFSSIERAKVNDDGTLGSWTTVANMAEPRWGVKAVANGGWLYVLGGVTTGSTYLASVLRARINDDGSLGPWLSAGSMTTARGWGPAVVASGYIFYLGGSTTGGQRLSSIERAKINADGSLGTWEIAGSLSEAKTDGAAVVAGAYLFYIGGYNGTYLYKVEKAAVGSDGTIGSWVTTSSLNENRSSLAALEVNGYLYAMGGGNGVTVVHTLKTVERAKINSDGSLAAWTMIGSMTAYR